MTYWGPVKEWFSFKGSVAKFRSTENRAFTQCMNESGETKKLSYFLAHAQTKVSLAKQKRKNQPIAKSGIEHCHWFILPLLLATPTIQFLLDRERRSHKQNQCSASDSVGFIFTRSYRSTLLITTPTTTPSLVKTSLKGLKVNQSSHFSCIRMFLTTLFCAV